MAVQFKSNMPYVEGITQEQQALLTRLLLEDIHRNSNLITPMKDGDLRKRVKKVIEKPTRGVIEWETSYAWYQERGYTSGPVRNYTTPGTQAHFAEDSVKKTTQNFENIANLVKKL